VPGQEPLHRVAQGVRRARGFGKPLQASRQRGRSDDSLDGADQRVGQRSDIGTAAREADRLLRDREALGQGRGVDLLGGGEGKEPGPRRLVVVGRQCQRSAQHREPALVGIADA